jgi:hypothetical protein
VRQRGIEQSEIVGRVVHGLMGQHKTGLP